MTFRNKSYRFLTGLVGVLSVFLAASCSQITAPPAVYTPGEKGAAVPVITGVDPPGNASDPMNFAYAGYTTIRIHGSNFSDSAGGNWIYFNGVPAKLVSSSPAELDVLSPDTSVAIGDTVHIRVAVPGAFNYADTTYPVRSIAPDAGYFNQTEHVEFVDFGKDGSMYAFYWTDVDNESEGHIARVSSQGVRVGGDYAAVADFPASPVWDMRMGAGDTLYYMLKNAARRSTLYMVPPGGGTPVSYLEFSRVSARFFDFDKSGNIYVYAGGIGGGVYFVARGSNNPAEVGDIGSLGLTPRAIRVYYDPSSGQPYLFVLGTDPISNDATIHRSAINADGTLGNSSLVFDQAGAGEYSNALTTAFYSMTLSAAGDIYVCTSNPTNPVLVVQPDGSYSTLLPGLLHVTPNSCGIVWDNGTYLYQFQTEENSIYRIQTFVQGAKYYGRN